MRNKIALIFILYLNGNFLFSQAKKEEKPAETKKVLLKTDIRAILLQPGVSIEYFFSKKISLEVGSSYFWTGQKIYGDELGDRFGLTLLGVGSSKGYDLYSDIKYSFADGLYLGAGYFYRYSHFKNEPYFYEMSEYNYQHYRQSENAYSNMLRITFGSHYIIKNNFYANPYIAIMIGNTDIQVDIDTSGADNYANYSPRVFPKHEKLNLTIYFVEIGFKFCFDINSKAKKNEVVEIKNVN